MDASLLNFYKEVNFSSHCMVPYDNSERYDGNKGVETAAQDQHEDDAEILAGDVGHTPTRTGESTFHLSTPSKEDLNNIMSEWSNFVTSDVNDALPVDTDAEHLQINEDDFDITKYVEESECADAAASEDDEIIDVQTLSDDIDIKINVLRLEMGVDIPQLAKNRSIRKPKIGGGKRIDMERRRYVVDEAKEKLSDEEEKKGEGGGGGDEEEDVTIDVETVESSNAPVLQAGDMDSLLQEFEAAECTNLQLDMYKLPAHQINDVTTVIEEEENNEISLDVIVEKVKLISPLKSSPEIDEHKLDRPEVGFDTCTANERMKKRRILESLPSELLDRIRQSRKRKPVQVIEPITPLKRRQSNKIADYLRRKTKNMRNAQLDHDYCLAAPSKDSGFSSCEEDAAATLTAPLVVHSQGSRDTPKKKLNLEEYKKRLRERNDRIDQIVNDENARRLKIMKSAQQTYSKSKDSLPILPIITSTSPDIIAKKDEVKVRVVDVNAAQPANKLLMKTLVSAATNTEECWRQLEEILVNAPTQFTSSSLLTSIAQHLPQQAPVIAEPNDEHGEDKTIVFVDPVRDGKQVHEVGVQTEHSSSYLINKPTRRRRQSSTGSSCSSTSRSRSPSPEHKLRKEAMKMVEERRVLFVGRLPDDTTREDLRRRFVRFGPIANVSVHFRQHFDNFGFVTFVKKEHAYEAIEKGNSDPNEPHYELCFGGRRLFCQSHYEDLDDMRDDEYEYWMPPSEGDTIDERSFSDEIEQVHDDSFDNLLRIAKAKLRRRIL